MNIFNSFELLFPIFGVCCKMLYILILLMLIAACIYLVGYKRHWFDVKSSNLFGLLYVSLFIVLAGLEPAASV